MCCAKSALTPIFYDGKNRLQIKKENLKVAEAEPYEVYIDRYCRVKGGQKLNPDDFGFVDDVGFRGFDEVRKLAFSLATDDADNNRPMRTKSEFEGFIYRVCSKSR